MILDMTNGRGNDSFRACVIQALNMARLNAVANIESNYETVSGQTVLRRVALVVPLLA